MQRLYVGLLACFALTGCHVSDDELEPNDDVTHATPLAAGEQREAIVILGNDDFYATEVSAATTLRWRLRSTGHEKEARIALVDPSGKVPELPADPACAAADAPLPKLTCVAEGAFELEAAVAAGMRGVVVVYQPALCVDCFTPESSEYTVSVDAVKGP